jgi:hypothetical protein
MSVLASLLWIKAIWQDLARRELSVSVLVGLTFLALVGRPWPWWLAAALALAWPWRRWAGLLALAALAAGAATGDRAPVIALATGATAWSLGWWGGADAILMLALALRHGLVGLMGGCLGLVVMGTWLMVRRGRPLRHLLAALPDVVAQRPVEAEIPDEAEMPAAVALAAAGLVMEGALLCQTLFG